MTKLIQKYMSLLEQAEQATDRKQAIRLIRESTVLRQQIAEFTTPQQV